MTGEHIVFSAFEQVEAWTRALDAVWVTSSEAGYCQLPWFALQPAKQPSMDASLSVLFVLRTHVAIAGGSMRAKQLARRRELENNMHQRAWCLYFGASFLKACQLSFLVAFPEPSELNLGMTWGMLLGVYVAQA